MMNADPHANHRRLQKLVGEWSFESEAQMGLDEPPVKSSGTESVRALGELWVLGEGRGTMPDGKPATMLITLGYDPQRERFVGTWIGSMMTHLWVYDGRLDAAQQVLTLEAEGPDFGADPGKLRRYRDIIAWIGDDHRTLTSCSLGDDGKWSEPFMTSHYRRTR
jgi:hypothetical protein